ncbi:hypothetical protein [Mycobacterium noviomagense]|uniref:Uncharacterized protein n=1 Tax=Mycobacterium noviomagense TaxID=459858 RepID=A0ABX3T444_9MYCO|nr:hypothetical protein [Mycobacterium noviomagense]ORB12998.1 hypothetical protein BST37_14920 [Mycobacterium noviomagense]
MLFAERDVAQRVAQILRAVEGSTTWGEFHAAMPAEDWDHVVELWENWHGDDDMPPDDAPFSPDDVMWGNGGDYEISPWLPLVERQWFPQDLIDEYGGEVEWANGNYDQLYLPGVFADDIAEELRARGHQVEKTINGDLNYWLKWRGDTLSEDEQAPKSGTPEQPLIVIIPEANSKDEIEPDARHVFESHLRKTRAERLIESWQPPPGDTTWGPYFQALFPPRRVTAFIDFKRKTSGLNIARRLWDQREDMRREYEALHGTDHAQWPTQHPGVVLDAVPEIARPACLGCQWLHPRGVSMGDVDWRVQAAEIALRHQDSNGAYIGDRRN